jgi:hypothetical protein
MLYYVILCYKYTKMLLHNIRQHNTTQHVTYIANFRYISNFYYCFTIIDL